MADEQITDEDRTKAKALHDDMHKALAGVVAIMDAGRAMGLLVAFKLTQDPDPAKPAVVDVTVQKIVNL